MNLTNITELCDIQIGRTPKRSEVKYWGNGHSWLSIADMGEKYVYDSKEEVTNLAVEECRMKIVPKNTVVMSFKLTIGRLGITEKDLYTNEAIAAFLIKDKNLLLPEYLYYSLKGYNFDHLIDRAAKGKTLNKRKLSEIYIPLIPIDNQKKIIEILNKAENLLVKRQQQIEALSALKQSVFLDMFGDPIRNDKKWQTYKIKEYSDSIVPGRNKPKSFTGHIPWITTEDLIDKGVTYKSKSEIGLTEAEIKKVNARIIPRESVLMTCVGDLGRVSIAGKDCVVNQQLHTYQPTECLNNIFLMYFLSHQKPYMYKYATTTTVPYMNKTTCNNMIVYLPPIELQESFAQKILQIDHRLNLISNSLEEIKLLYDSLLHKAFNGELFKEEIKA
ncbi:restriction endonuclease subunit S [Globicatella sulfidifaciens]|uniref:Type I restriction modification DNA specificity domain-containing protein n=1 Tax=Globicatella sulfidifaciens TaxID=136093 RepID=A0A7X8C3E1_9LACT|nr:restriction endonuclease subunit S [Globicatella sulfidifaciens]NLJ18098.1 hypothetical protein [Globicatella sulfidifaciens]